MKRKSLIILLTVIIIAGCLTGLVACNNDDSGDVNEIVLNGTYYLLNDGQIDLQSYIIFDSITKTWVDDEGMGGLYDVWQDGNISMMSDDYGAVNGKIDGDIITLVIFGESVQYRKEDIEPQTTPKLQYDLSEDKSYYIVVGIGSESGDVVIPELYKNKPVKEIGESAFVNDNTVTSIKIPSSINTIGAKAFYKCKALNSVDIDFGVSSIGEGAFAECASLSRISIPASVIKIEPATFAYCLNLQSIVIPVSVTNLGMATFFGCKDIKVYFETQHRLDNWYPNWDLVSANVNTGRITRLKEVEWGYENIKTDPNYDYVIHSDKIYFTKYKGTDKEVTVPTEIDNKEVVSIGDVFTDTDITKIEIPESVTNIYDYAFYSCSKLTNFNFPSQLKRIGCSAFENCDGLTSISIPESVVEIDYYAFSSCVNLSTAKLPMSLSSISSGLFSGCENLLSVNIPEGIKEVGYSAFSNCKKLSQIVLPDSVKYVGHNAFLGCKFIKEYGNGEYIASASNPYFALVYVDKKTTSCTIHKDTKLIAEECFYECVNMTSVVIPKGVDYIGQLAFSGCDCMTIYCEIDGKPDGWDENWDSYEVENFDIDNSGVLGTDTELERYKQQAPIVWNCNNNECADDSNIYIIADDGVRYALHQVPANLENNNPWGDVARQSRALSGEVTVQNEIVYKGIKYTINLTAGPFEDCNALESVIISENFTILESQAFANCSNLREVKLPESLNYIGYKAFSNCSSLESIVIPQNVSSIRENAFLNCVSLASIEIKNNDEYDLYIYDNSFEGCDNIANAIIPITVLRRIPRDNLKNVKITSGNYIDFELFKNHNSLERVELSESITSVGSYAFYNCKNLKSIKLPNSLSDVGDYAFTGCNNLLFNEYDNGLYIGNEENPYMILIKAKNNNITSCVVNENTIFMLSAAFWDCRKIASITVPFVGSNKYGNHSRFDYIFAQDIYSTRYTVPVPTSLKEVIITGGDRIGDSAFSGCSSLTRVLIPTGVTSIDQWAFSNCSSISSIEIPNSVTSVGWGAFSGCSSLQFNCYDNVKYLGNEENPYYLLMELDNKETTNFVINTDTKLIYPYIFNSCVNLQFNEYNNALYLGDEKNPYKVLIKAKSNTITECIVNEDTEIINYSAFSDCSRLRSITLPFIGASFEDNSRFYYIFGMDSNNIPKSLKEVIITGEDSIDKMAFSGCSSLTSISIPNNVTSIGDYAFSGCSSLTSILIPNNVTSIGDYAFSGCSSLTSLEIPSRVTSIGNYVFEGCSSLTSIDIPNGVTSIGNYAFSYCGLTSVDIPSSVISIGRGAFSNCSSLASITLPFLGATKSGVDNTHFGYIFGARYNTGNFESMPANLKSVTLTGGDYIDDYAFFNCSNLTSIEIPSSVTSIGNYTFSSCGSLTSINIPSGVTSIGKSAFSGCSSLTSILIPNNITSIGDSAFSGCSSLTSLEIPSRVTSIGDYAFNECINLTKVEIPSSVIDIGFCAFWNCSNLTSIYIPSSVAHIGDSAFRNCDAITIYFEIESMPSGWKYGWNCDERPVVWGYKK